MNKKIVKKKQKKKKAKAEEKFIESLEIYCFPMFFSKIKHIFELHIFHRNL